MPLKGGPDAYRTYHRKQMLLRRRNQRLRAVEFLGGECATPGCGQRDPALLEFSHELGPKKFIAANLWGLRWAKIEAEIGKCRLRCAAHHAEIDPQRARTLGASSDHAKIDPLRAQTWAVDDPGRIYDDEVPF